MARRRSSWCCLLLLPLASCCSEGPRSPGAVLGREAVRLASTSKEATVTPLESAFLAVPSNDSARDTLRFLTAHSHVAGTKGDLDLALYVQRRFQEAGIPNAVIDPQRVLLAYPRDLSLDVVDGAGKVVASAKLAEKVLSGDPTSDSTWRNRTFNGYSPSGNVTARVVYANFGRPEDIRTLEAAGVSVTGAIALMRYGGAFRGLKAFNAQKAGAAAAILYSDPQQDGYTRGPVYPEGPWRPETSVQRGSVQFNSLCGGDPARAYKPQGRSVEEVCGFSQEEMLPQIPVIPISYGDALPLLQQLGGPAAPKDFQGALNVTYRMGPTKEPFKVALRVENRFQASPVWNVIASIPGSLPKDQDQPVVLGNHRDAWVFGAADPNSGTSALLEVARGLGELLRHGWRPLRTIYLCSWSGEEYGLLGSTAWGEVHGDSPPGDHSNLLSRALAYLNVDVGVAGPNLLTSGTPTMGSVLAGALGQVKDPATGKPLAEQWGEGSLQVLGSGSDYTVFVDHLGIASLDLTFVPHGKQYGVYHSVYDSFTWVATEVDPHFRYHVAISQVWGLVALRLAGTAGAPRALLQLNATTQAESIKAYIAEAKAKLNSTTRSLLSFSRLELAQADFSAAALQAELQAARIAAMPPSAARDKAVDDYNERLGLLERQFLTEEGLPQRKWFRHCLQAPGYETGYAAQSLPGIADAVEAGAWDSAQSQADIAADRIVAAARFLTPTSTAAVQGALLV